MLEGVSKINFLLKILLGILFVSISSWNNTISTRQKVKKKAEKHRTEPMTGEQFRFMFFLNVTMSTGFYLLLVHTFFN